MYCIRCGRELQAGASFCWNCGSAVGPPPAGRVVPPAPAPEGPAPTEAPTGPVLPAAVPGAPGGGEGWRPFDPANPPAVPAAPLPVAPPAAPAPPGQWARPFDAPAPPPGAAAAGDARPGGFWRRFFAVLIDTVLLNILNLPFALLWMPPYLEGIDAADVSPEQLSALMGGYLVAGTTGLLISWIYHAGLESSAAQATLGKMALGVKVCDRDLRRLTFGHATGRWLCKFASNLTFGIGYLMAAFTARKRALHDVLAGTRVIRG